MIGGWVRLIIISSIVGINTCWCCDILQNGVMHCERQDPETTCPKLDCDASEIIYVQNECCPICRGILDKLAKNL